jgi:hypothetical protein
VIRYLGVKLLITFPGRWCVIGPKAVVPAVFLLSSAIATAQIGGGTARAGTAQGTTGSGAQWFSASAQFPAMPFVGPTITGAPFSGVREYEHTQTLADGTHISQKNIVEKIWRDSDGRMRTERPMGRAPNMPEMPSIVGIIDPVAGYRYMLDTQNKIAHRTVIPPRPLPPPAPLAAQNQTGQATTVRQGAFSASAPPGVVSATATGGGITSTPNSSAPRRIQMQRESLGTKSIDGLTVEGTQMTHTIPAGEQGNDRPISIVTENWFSPDLREMVESATSDPRTGQSTTRLTINDRNNPDPALFQVPADYQIVDEQGPFNINYHR